MRWFYCWGHYCTLFEHVSTNGWSGHWSGRLHEVIETGQMLASPSGPTERERVGECGDTKWYNDKVANQELKIKCLCNQWTWNGVDMRRRANLIRDFFGPAWLFHRKPSTRSPRVGTEKEDAAAAQRCQMLGEAWGSQGWKLTEVGVCSNCGKYMKLYESLVI